MCSSCAREVSIKNKKRNLCARCYRNLLEDGGINEKPKCSVQDCERSIWTNNRKYCRMHQQRADLSGGNPEGLGRGSKGVPRPRGRRNMSGRYVNSDGYVRVRVEGAVGNGGWPLEHRYVMEQHLNRSLLPGENIHHLDGNRQNNAIDNLELWITLQPSGQRPEDLVAYAKEILRRYDTST